jgi:hypothetical protein
MSNSPRNTGAPQYRRVQVNRVISSRYAGDSRPDSWDLRQAGIDTVEVSGGEVLKLASTPMQSPPKPGWVLMLTGGDKEGYSWTLYGMSRR